ncbi:MAG: hypothetical protein U9N53_04030 [Bacteroidota bacterium]|nr:hypothetical protein [Bacteroidota bacterium]
MATQNDSNDKDNRNFIPESKETIAEGAKVFSEKASDIFSTFLEKVKGTAEAAYEKGNQIYENVALTSQVYLDRFKDRSEMTNLKEQRDEVVKELGYMCFMEYSGRYKFRVQFMKSEEFTKLMAQVRELDKQIIQIGEKFAAEG